MGRAEEGSSHDVQRIRASTSFLYTLKTNDLLILFQQTATRLAAELGISDDTLPQLTRVADPHGACILGATWQGVQMLERTLLAAELVALSNPQPLQQHQHASSALSSQATGAHGHNRSGVPSLW